jgi:hypothetical protein
MDEAKPSALESFLAASALEQKDLALALLWVYRCLRYN